jgi:hypothetical protein
MYICITTNSAGTLMTSSLKATAQLCPGYLVPASTEYLQNQNIIDLLTPITRDFTYDMIGIDAASISLAFGFGFFAVVSCWAISYPIKVAIQMIGKL